MENLIVALAVVFVAIIILLKTAVVVPQQNAYVVERLGKYSKSLNAGFHILIPFIERVAYKHTLKEHAADIAEQICITKDNVQVGVDGVLYMQVLDPSRASYGIGNYMFAISQLAQTTLRSEIGKIDLDRTFEERGTINQNVVAELDKASDPWGVKVLRYEIKNINPPQDVLGAMEKQMRAEREKRAVILNSEGERDAKINQAEGEKQRVIKESEAVKTQKRRVRRRPFLRSRRRPRKDCAGSPMPSPIRADRKQCNCVLRSSTSANSATWRKPAIRLSCQPISAI
jgi:regulator of protease activity HflC (stomatin/prohibitin superfamily)